ncbi:Nucleoside phosphorylase domain [Sesbania bispinosa]|nr:Nucleoside phosphorylase domain [Sesbania bispinosa]
MVMVLFVHHHVLKLISILITLCTLSDCYDPLDPNGNISVTFDIYQSTDNGYLARVTVQNYYLYRHVDKPGWKLGWTWANNEVIWSMNGAFATDRGNCLGYSGSQMPHSCKKDPTIVDLTPQVSQNRSEHCCRGGLLSAWAIDPLNSFSSFELEVRNLGKNPLGQPPTNLTLMAPGPGYTCSPFLDTDPTLSSDFGGLRQVPVLSDPSLPESNEDNIIECSDHMCPIRVHWHFKNNYMDHWRVKLTISNYNYKKNFSNWNVLVQHPGFSQKATIYSFNSTKLPAVGLQDGVALFWGIDFYNSELLHSDEGRQGIATTEILLEKDPNSFTLRNGWAFPRRIYFNGEDCEMPLPDTFPMLPNETAMAALGDQSPEEAMVASEPQPHNNKPISNIVIVIAMQTEALPVVNRFQLTEDPHSPFPEGVPWVRYHGTYKDLNINLIWPGKDPGLGVDSVGTISSALVTYAAIQALQPDLIINAGTAGGFKAKGASIGDIFIASDCAFHDRRIPIPVFDLYGVGLRKAFETPNLVKELNLKVAKLSTGDSLDMTPQDESSIIANDATVKDMEGAAVAYVADLLKVPAIFIKAVTDIVDGDKPTAEEFLQNLASVTAALDLAVEQVINFINGKCVSEL